MASQVEVAQRGAAGKGVKGRIAVVYMCVSSPMPAENRRRNARNDTSAKSFELYSEFL